MKTKIKIIIGAIIAAVGFYGLCMAVPLLNERNWLVPSSIVVMLFGAIMIIAGIKDLSETPDREDGVHYCHLHRHNVATERCSMCQQWTCDVGAHRDSYGRLICPLCYDKISKRAFAEQNHIPYKSKTTAVLLALFLGCLGIHRIYLGRKNGFVYLAIMILFCWTIVVPLVIAICAIIDLVMIATNQWQDQYYRDLI
jgi:TM2 domain-containing membrane protein YozV